MVVNNDKIISLTRELVSELKAQGYDMRGINCDHVDVWVFNGNKIQVESICNHWKIDCGVINQEEA